jgi:hypothetical protein
VAITCPDGERFKRRSVQQFSNPRNHRQNLSRTGTSHQATAVCQAP